ncbi:MULTISPECIES: alpha/beta hydrolase [Zoogloea]|uniref:Serine aminopeptidase S33 domain-containing protein n=1 Tax=Zoogloea oleivorans TaxID=1552750 RepID=A0A6C2CFD6_9RHOO|nr:MULTISPECIES: alpha/beta hydrolase [Zoogloea]MBP8132717.1 alpha/beta hydrolase [Zoogloea sp.]MDD2669838.1 alpha/beta hydrolase [Zoogloea sp.]MDY0038403.1 alpha/beta hydrolase [Zoogloea oleivorans]TYC52376.1 hypothetical protein ETQ85_22840 [Zoogloea oleivorans]
MGNSIQDPTVAGYMGAADRQLFYCYHAPQGASTRPFGVVLCPPAGREYVFAHRTFRQLATRLSRAGFPVLRFDYFASGDSAGEDDEGSVEQWLDDIASAIDTFRNHTAGARVCLAGFRIGASLAALHAATHQDVDSLILWDPVISGERYVDGLLADHEHFLRLRLWREKTAMGADGVREIVGFLLSPRLESGLRSIRLDTLPAPARRALLMSSSPTADPERFGEHLEALGMQIDRQHVAWPEFWTGNEELDDVLMPPARVLQAIVGWAQGQEVPA